MATDIFGNPLDEEELRRQYLHQIAMGIAPHAARTKGLAIPPSVDYNQVMQDWSDPGILSAPAFDVPRPATTASVTPTWDTGAVSGVPQTAMTRHERSKLQLPIGPFTPLPDFNVPAFTPLGPSQQVPARIRQTIPTANDPTGGLSAADANAAAYMAALSGDQAAMLEEGGLLGGGIPSGDRFDLAQPNWRDQALAEAQALYGSGSTNDEMDLIDAWKDTTPGYSLSATLRDIVQPSGYTPFPSASYEDYMETEVPTATTEPAGFSTETGAGGFTGGSQMFDMGMDPTFANTGGWGPPQDTVSLPEVLGWAAVPPAAKGLVSMGKKGLDWMGPYKGYHDLGSRWDTLGGILDVGQVLGKVVGIPTAIAALGYDALTESPEEFRQSVLEDVETTPFSSTLDAATIGETTTPNQYGGYGIPSAIAVDQQGNPINLDSISRPSRTGRTARTDRTGADISIPGLNPLADAGITVQDLLDTAYNENIGMGQVASHPGQGGHVGGPTDPDITIPEMLARQDARTAAAVMAPRQQAMPEVSVPAPTAPTVASQAAQNRLAQQQADAAIARAAQAAAARDAARQAQAASAAQAQAAQADARAVLAAAVGRDRGGPSDREIAAAREVLSQIDTFDSGGMMTETQRAMRDVGYGGGFAAGRGDTGATGQGGWT